MISERKILSQMMLTTQDAFLDQLFAIGPVAELLLQAVGAHVLLQVLLLALDGGRGGRVWQNVAF